MKWLIILHKKNNQNFILPPKRRKLQYIILRTVCKDRLLKLSIELLVLQIYLIEYLSLIKDKVEALIYTTTEGMVPEQWLEMLHNVL